MAQKAIEQVALDLIVLGSNVRTQLDAEPLANLAGTIKARGVQIPLILLRGRDGKLCLLDGRRRLEAARLAGLATVPCVIEDVDLPDAEVIQRQFLLNCQREDLTPLEKAQAISALMKKTSWSVSQTAANLGVSNATATRLMALLRLSPAIQERVKTGEIPASSAYEIARVEDPERQAELASQVVTGLTRDALSVARRASRHPAPSCAAAPAARITAKLSGNRSVTVCAADLNLERFIAALEELLTRARQAQRKGLALDTFRKVLVDTAKSTT